MNRFVFVLFLIITLQAHCALAVNGPSWRQKSDVLTVGLLQQENFPLIFFDRETNPLGFEVAMVRHLAKSGGFSSLQFKQFPDQEALQLALRNHEVDFAFSKMKKNLDDAQHLIYAEPHLSLQYVFLFNRLEMAANDLQAAPLSGLAKSGITVGTLDSPLYTDQLEKLYPGVNIRVFAAKEAIFKAVISGEVGACYLDEMEVQDFFLRSPAKALYLHYVKGKTYRDSIALVFPWDKLFFREWVNSFLVKYGYTTTQLSGLIRQYSPDLFDLQQNR